MEYMFLNQYDTLEHVLYIMILFWEPDNLPQGYLKPRLVSSMGSAVAQW